MTVTLTVITPLTKQILKSTMTIPSQMVIASSVVIMILLRNIILYTIIHKTKRTLFCNNSPQRPNAGNRFQVMLHDLIMKNKSSLQMFDNICNLVNEYISSPDFLVNTKLQSQKSFLRSVEGSYCTRLLRPYNRNVRLHDGTIVTIPVFDIKSFD